MATIKARSLGTKATYNTGTVTVSGAGLILTLSVAGTWDSNWGEGDAITIDGEVRHVLTRDSSNQVTLQVATTKTGSGLVHSIARSYSSLSTWEAASPANLVTDDSVWKGVCYNDAEFTGSVNITGITTDATRYAWLTVAVGHRHTLAFETGARLDRANATGVSVRIGANFTVVEWLEIKNHAGTGDQAGAISFCATDCTARNLLIYNLVTKQGWGTHNASGNSAFRCYMYNCIIYNMVTGIYDNSVSTSRNLYYNNTVTACTTGIDNTQAASNYGAMYYNNISIGNSTADWANVGVHTGQGDANVGGSTTLIPGTRRLVSNTTAEFDSASARNFRLGHFALSKASGYNASAIFTNDVAGTPRYDTQWDRGAIRQTTVQARSIGDATVRAPYSTGSISTDATGLIVTLTGGSFDAHWGEGDKITTGDFSNDFSDDFGGETIGYVLRRNSATELIMQAPFLVNAVGVAFKIERSYTSVATWFAASPANLVTADYIYKGVMYNDSAFVVGTTSIDPQPPMIILTGLTTDVSRYIDLTVAVGQRHSGQRYVTSGVRIEAVSGHYGIVLAIEQAFSKTSYLQIKQTGAGQAAISTGGGGGGQASTIYNCIAYGSYNNGENLSGIVLYNTTVFNCLVYGAGFRKGIVLTGAATVYNCTVDNIQLSYETTTPGAYTTPYGFSASAGSNTCINCISTTSSLFSGASYAGSFTTASNNLSQDQTAPGTSAVKGKLATDQFISIVGGSEDYGLKAGSSAIGVGAIQSLFTFDLKGATRSFISWDLGAVLISTIRYWVGVNTNTSESNNWSLTSGGAGGAGVPTAVTDAVLDIESNTFAHCTLNTTLTCLGLYSSPWCNRNLITTSQNINAAGSINLNSTGTLTITGSIISLYGNLTFAATLGTFVVGGTQYGTDGASILFNKTGSITYAKSTTSYWKKLTLAKGVTCTILTAQMAFSETDANTDPSILLTASDPSDLTYSTGTMAVNAGGTAATLTGGLISDELTWGDRLILDPLGTPETIYILNRVSATSLNLMYQGAVSKAGQSGLAYRLEKMTVLRLETNGGVAVYRNGTRKPIEDNGGTIMAMTGYSVNYYNSLDSDISLPRIRSGGSLVLNLNNPPADKTTTYRMTAPIICRLITIGNNTNVKSTTIFRTDNHNILLGTTSGALSLRAYSTSSNFSTVKFYAGSSTIRLEAATNPLTLIADSVSGKISVIELYMESSTWQLSGVTSQTFVVNGTLTVDGGTSLLDVFGTAAKTLSLNDKPFYNVRINQNSANAADLTTALRCNRLLLEPNTIVKFKEGVTHVIGAYTAGDWDGTAGNLVTIKSITDTFTHNLTVPSDISVSYVSIRDSIASQKIASYTSNGCVDGPPTGTNTNWIFTPGSWFLLTMQNELYHSKEI